MCMYIYNQIWYCIIYDCQKQHRKQKRCKPQNVSPAVAPPWVHARYGSSLTSQPTPCGANIYKSQVPLTMDSGDASRIPTNNSQFMILPKSLASGIAPKGTCLEQHISEAEWTTRCQSSLDPGSRNTCHGYPWMLLHKNSELSRRHEGPWLWIVAANVTYPILLCKKKHIVFQ